MAIDGGGLVELRPGGVYEDDDGGGAAPEDALDREREALAVEQEGVAADSGVPRLLQAGRDHAVGGTAVAHEARPREQVPEGGRRGHAASSSSRWGT